MRIKHRDRGLHYLTNEKTTNWNTGLDCLTLTFLSDSTRWVLELEISHKTSLIHLSRLEPHED